MFVVVIAVAIYPIISMKLVYDVINDLDEKRDQIHLFYDITTYNLVTYTSLYIIINK